MLIFLAKLYTRGTKDMDELKKIFVYWLERIIREAKGDLITVMFDMNGCGLSNMDMDYTKYMIDTMKYYYPASINYILVLEIPWILNGESSLKYTIRFVIISNPNNGFRVMAILVSSYYRNRCSISE